MRILQVTPYFAPAWAYGGPPRVMTDFAAGLVELGHEVDVFTTDVLDAEHRATPEREVIDGARVRRFRNLSNELAWRTKKYLPLALPVALARSAGHYDAIHVTDTRTFLTASAHLATATRRMPLVISAHGSLPGSTGLRGVVKSAYDRVLVNPMLRNAALLLAQTDHEARLYDEFGAKPAAVRFLPLPLAPIAVNLGALRGAFRAEIGLADDERLLLFLGRINRLKGLDVLIESVCPLLGSGTTLAVVGRDDGQQPEIEARFGELIADGRVRLIGPLYGDDRFRAYVDADVFCLTPPHWEETSVAALEAAACGTAVVVSEQADIPGLVASGGGFVVPLEQERVREAVAAALADPDEIGSRARRHVLEQHDRDSVVALLERHLRSVV
jgi:glycosyltransferase involved in cell wall biosynthesis